MTTGARWALVAALWGAAETAAFERTTECRVASDMSVPAVVGLGARCQGIVAMEIRRRGPASIPELLALFRSKPELRSVVVGALLRLDDVGLPALTGLGVDAIPAMADVSEPYGRWSPALRAMGSPARDVLQGMLFDREERVRRFAAEYMLALGSGELPVLLKAANESPDPFVRTVCATAAIESNAERALPDVLKLLTKGDLDRGDMLTLADALSSVEDQRAVDALTALIQDPRVDRGVRWEIAEKMKRSPRPRMVAAARKHGPSGWQGHGNPESPRGTILTWLFVVATAALVARWRGALGFGERTRVVIGVAAGAYSVALAGRIASAFLMLAYIPGLLHGVSLLVLFGGATVGGALVKPQSVGMDGVRIAAASGSFFLLFGIGLDRWVNWYLARMRDVGLGALASPLLVATTLFGSALGVAVYEWRLARKRLKGEPR